MKFYINLALASVVTHLWLSIGFDTIEILEAFAVLFKSGWLIHVLNYATTLFPIIYMLWHLFWKDLFEGVVFKGEKS